MTRADRIVLLQKQVAVAVKALKTVKDEGGSTAWHTASEALDEIERIKFVQEGRHE